MAKGIKIKDNWKTLFLKEIKKGRSVEEAARVVKVGLDKLTFEKNHDQEFYDAWQEAKINRASRGPQW